MELQKKILLTRNRMQEILARFDPRSTAVAWSGGKDSTIVMALWVQTLQETAPKYVAQAVSIDTGLKFPEVLKYRQCMAEKWGVRVLIAKPDVDLSRYPVAEDAVRCCLDLKIAPLQACLARHGIKVLLTGIRHDEHQAREGIPWLEEKNNGFRAHVLHHWTEMDVWAWTMQERVPYCTLYDKGYRSLGCRPCTARPEQAGLGERDGRSRAKEDRMAQLRSLGYF
jgi:phosphoadenosine phosphosulfate reductase